MRVRVTSTRVSGGQELIPPESGMVLLVGPNNSGKSQALRDLNQRARDDNYAGRALLEVRFSKSHDGDFADWVGQHLTSIERDGRPRLNVPSWGEVTIDNVVTQWLQPSLNVLSSIFVLHLDGNSRLTAGDSQPSIDFSLQHPTHPVQHAYLRSDLEKMLDEASRAAFNLGIVVDRYAGGIVSLRVGDRPPFEHESGRPEQSYFQELKRLGKLEEQGDGVRSYVGLLLHILAGVQEILLIDEPEAFLHPPQARLLGKVLAEHAKEKQVFAATHSSDIVRGALEGNSSITIVRITRDGDVNHAAVLPDSAVKELWADPLLRYSNVLDGLFHDAVVLCEGDADCRYYSAVLEHLPRTVVASREPQLLFTHCGGKDRMASVVKSLRAVSVPVIVVADFDVLREAATLRRLVISLGGDFGDFENDREVLGSSLSNDIKPLRKTTLRDELLTHLDGLPAEVVTPKQAETVRAIIKAEDGWEKAKRAGKEAVPQGDAYAACGRLLAGLKEIGLLVVPVGELERFSPSTPGHGPSWVTAALEAKAHETPGTAAIEFVGAIRELALASSPRAATTAEHSA